MTACIFDNCPRISRTKKPGYCSAHYEQARAGKELKPVRYQVPKQAGVRNPMLGPYLHSATGYMHYVFCDAQGKKYTKVAQRVVMEEILGRPLTKDENVHHLNGVKTDNRPENLELWVTSQPFGQRPEDLLQWADEIIRRYRHA